MLHWNKLFKCSLIYFNLMYRDRTWQDGLQVSNQAGDIQTWILQVGSKWILAGTWTGNVQWLCQVVCTSPAPKSKWGDDFQNADLYKVPTFVKLLSCCVKKQCLIIEKLHSYEIKIFNTNYQWARAIITIDDK